MAVEEAEAALFAPEKNVFGGGQVLDQVELLRNPADGDAGFEDDPPGSGFDRAGQAFGEGGFPGAVLADQTENAARAERERHVVEGLFRIIAFGQILYAKHRLSP